MLYTCFHQLILIIICLVTHAGFESSEGGTQFGEFTKSIERDSECASNLLSSYNSDVNEKSRHQFLTAVGDCKGQVFTSGIGK